MKQVTSVDPHLKYMKAITDKLAAFGAPISEEDQVNWDIVRKFTKKFCDTCHRH